MFDIANGRENPNSYALRIKNSYLPNWPTEVLIEWFYRHNPQLERYSFLGFERFIFERQSWELNEIPDQDCFDNPAVWDDIVAGFKTSPTSKDWVAKYIFDHGTWSTPIVMLDNRCVTAGGKLVESLKGPFHLLEGHHRLAFLVTMRGKVWLKDYHDVWVVRLEDLNLHNHLKA